MTLLAMVAVCYFRACFVDPGHPPRGWEPDDDAQAVAQSIDALYIDDDTGAAEGNDSLPGGPKRGRSRPRRAKCTQHPRCRRCESHKPLRSHHCSVCRRCVLRMDHHCPWINNCVGSRNYKSFFLFVGYTVAAGVHTCGLAAGRVFFSQAKFAVHEEAVFLIFMCIVVPVTLLVLCLFSFHLTLVAKNYTTIEYQQAQYERWTYGPKHSAVNPYDLGFVGNLKAVLGSNVLLWPFPTLPENDGIHWQVRSRESVQREKAKQKRAKPQKKKEKACCHGHQHGRAVPDRANDDGVILEMEELGRVEEPQGDGEAVVAEAQEVADEESGASQFAEGIADEIVMGNGTGDGALLNGATHPVHRHPHVV